MRLVSKWEVGVNHVGVVDELEHLGILSYVDLRFDENGKVYVETDKEDILKNVMNLVGVEYVNPSRVGTIYEGESK